jgi:hypothetical protein
LLLANHIPKGNAVSLLSAVGNPFKNAHIVWVKALRLQHAGIVSQRRYRQACGRGGKADTGRVGADGPCRIDKINRVNPITTTALRVVSDIFEDSKSTEVVIFSYHVGRIPKLSNVEACQRGGIFGILRYQCLVFGLKELRSSTDNDAVRLRISAVTGIACSVAEVCSVGVVQDGRKPIGRCRRWSP